MILYREVKFSPVQTILPDTPSPHLLQHIRNIHSHLYFILQMNFLHCISILEYASALAPGYYKPSLSPERLQTPEEHKYFLAEIPHKMLLRRQQLLRLHSLTLLHAISFFYKKKCWFRQLWQDNCKKATSPSSIMNWRHKKTLIQKG